MAKMFEAVTTDAAPGGSEGSSTPASTSTESAGASGASADFDFAELATHEDFGDEPSVSSEGEVATAASPPTATPAEASSPATASASAPTAATPPPPQPAEPTPPQPPATATAIPPTATAETPAEPFDFAKHREAFVPKLAELYKLSDDEVEAFRTNPGEILPKIAANLHYEVQAAVFSSVLQSLPQVLDMAFNQRKAVDEADNAFYSRWPKLKEGAHLETVTNAIRAYRTANPKAPMDKVIEQAGLMAMISLGLNPQEAVAAVPATAPAVAAPVSPLAPRPAGIGAAGHVTPQQPGGGLEENIFEALAEAHLRGDI